MILALYYWYIKNITSNNHRSIMF